MTVTIVAVGCLLLLVGAPWWVPASAIALALSPVAGLAVGLAALVTEVIRTRRSVRPPSPVSRIVRGFADELGTGHTLHQVVRWSPSPAVGSEARRLAFVGAPAGSIADALGSVLGRHATTFRSAVVLSEQSGGSLARALHELADEVEQDEAADGDRRVASSQARFSALVVGVVPLAIAALVVGLRGVPEPGGAVIVVPMTVGAVLMIAGSAVVGWMSRTGHAP